LGGFSRSRGWRGGFAFQGAIMAKDYSAIDDLAKLETQRFLRTKDMRFLECAIELMLTDYSPEEVEAILRQQADMIRELG